VCRVEIADGGDVCDVGILRIDRDTPDVMRQVKTEMRPGLAGIRRLVDAVAVTV
jgi:hypothetical protein